MDGMEPATTGPCSPLGGRDAGTWSWGVVAPTHAHPALKRSRGRPPCRPRTSGEKWTSDGGAHHHWGRRKRDGAAHQTILNLDATMHHVPWILYHVNHVSPGRGTCTRHPPASTVREHCVRAQVP